MSRDTHLYLEDMRDYARNVCRYAAGVTIEGFVANDEKRDAIIRNLELLGEAAKHIPEAVRARHGLGEHVVFRIRRFPLSLAVAYAIVGLFFSIESRLRQGEGARTLKTESTDEGTTRLIGASFGAALIGTPVLTLLGIGRIKVPGFVGPAVMVLGLGLRVWAAWVLGRFYTRTLRVASDQTLVRSGPYCVVRHPGYLGSLLLWLGFGLASLNGLATVLITALMAYAYSRRMKSEEAMLLRSLGEPYREYTRATWRLIPGVY